MKPPRPRHPSAAEFAIGYDSDSEETRKLGLECYQQPPEAAGADSAARAGSTFRPTDARADGDANEYALPLPRYRPEYATPIATPLGALAGDSPAPGYLVPAPARASPGGSGYDRPRAGSAGADAREGPGL